MSKLYIHVKYDYQNICIKYFKKGLLEIHYSAFEIEKIMHLTHCVLGKWS